MSGYRYEESLLTGMSDVKPMEPAQSAEPDVKLIDPEVPPPTKPLEVPASRLNKTYAAVVIFIVAVVFFALLIYIVGGPGSSDSVGARGGGGGDGGGGGGGGCPGNQTAPQGTPDVGATRSEPALPKSTKKSEVPRTKPAVAKTVKITKPSKKTVGTTKRATPTRPSKSAKPSSPKLIPTAAEVTVPKATPEKGRSTTPKLPQLADVPLICTYSKEYSDDMEFPEDGLCDVIFYDSLYCNDENAFLDSPSSDLSEFLDLLKGFKKTAFGISVSYRYAAFEPKKVNMTTIEKGLDYFWDRGVQHFGILDAETRYLQGQGHVTEIFKFLQDLDKYRKYKRKTAPSKACYLFLGVSFNVPRSGEVYTTFEKNFLSLHVIDALIARTHLSESDRSFKDCRITGPSVLKDPFSDYQPAMLPVLEYLDKHARGKWAFKLMISVTMKARWYKPRDLQDPDKPETYAPGKSCTGFTQDKFSRFTYSCIDEPGYFEEPKMDTGGRHIMHTYRTQSKWAFTFDNDRTIKLKFCECKLRYDKINFGFALYDLQYEDYHQLCPEMSPSGNFSRVRKARKVVDFFKKSNHDDSACKKL